MPKAAVGLELPEGSKFGSFTHFEIPRSKFHVISTHKSKTHAEMFFERLLAVRKPLPVTPTMKAFIAAAFLAVTVCPLLGGWVWPWEGEKLDEAANQVVQIKAEKDHAVAEVATAKHQTKVIKGILVAAIIAVILLGALAGYFYIRRTVVTQVVTQPVVQNVIKQEIVVRSPAHAITHDSYAIDGLNVIRSFSPYQPPSIAILLTLLLAICQRGWTFKCFFDNNAFYVFREANLLQEASLYVELCREFPDNFIEVPTRNRADDYILDYAHKHGTPIISNDRYREYAQTYPWIETDPARRISGILNSNAVQVIPLDIFATLDCDLSSLVAALRDLLSATHNVSSE